MNRVITKPVEVPLTPETVQSVSTYVPPDNRVPAPKQLVHSEASLPSHTSCGQSQPSLSSR